MKTIRPKKRSLTDQIALLRTEIVPLHERIKQLEARPTPQFTLTPPVTLPNGGQTPFLGYPRPYTGDPWPGHDGTITSSTPIINSSFKLPEEKA